MAVTNAPASYDVLLVDVNPFAPPVPPLGLEVLATALARARFSCRVCSASPRLPDYGCLLDQLERTQSHVIGVQIRNYDHALLRHERPSVADFYRELARRLRRHAGNVPIVLGGAGFSIDPQFWLRILGADYGIVGSGERPLVCLLSVLLRHVGALQDVPNLVLPGGSDSSVRWSPDILERVDRRHLAVERWRRAGPDATGPLPWASIEVSRGCRYRCDFCVEPRVHGQRPVFKDPVDVIGEIDAIRSQGVTDFFLCNSEFNLDETRALALCRAMADAGLGDQIRWVTYAVPTRLSGRLADAMAHAGCRSLSFNAVHVDDGILESLSCPHRRASYERCLDAATAAGLEVSSTFLLGTALESSETLDAFMSFVDRRGLTASVSLGLAQYPILPKHPARGGGGPLRVYRGAGNETVPYVLSLGTADLDRFIAWAASHPTVQVLNAPLPVLRDHLRMQPAAADSVRPGQPRGDPADVNVGFAGLIRDISGEDESRARRAIDGLRHDLVLLDLPDAQLAREPTIPAPPDPFLGLYGPYRQLSRFYLDLQQFFESAADRPDAISRFLLRAVDCVGEFPRLLSAARPWLDDDSIEWLHRRWRDQHALDQIAFAVSYGCQSRCPYCYATGVGETHPGELSECDFHSALDWAARQGCRVVSFVGGEPTLHPRMRTFLADVRARGMQTYFNSNLLCEPDLLRACDGTWVRNVGIHAQAARYTPRHQGGHLAQNIETLRANGVPLFLRYTFEQRTPDAIDDALALAASLGVAQVNFALPMPSLNRRNRYVPETELLASGTFLIAVVERFRAAGLRPILAKPIPPCAVPEDRLGLLRSGEALSPSCNLPQRGWTQNVLVGPDLSISPCVGLTTRGPSLLSFRDFGSVSAYLMEHLSSLLRPVPFRRCHSCNFHLDRRCLGGCAAYFAHAASAPLSVRHRGEVTV